MVGDCFRMGDGMVGILILGCKSIVAYTYNKSELL